MEIFESYSAEATYEYARQLAEKASPGDVYCLSGDLGVGKTIFAKGFGAGLGIKEAMSSPTFTIVQEYDEGRIPLYHYDVYRVGDVDEMEETGFYEYAGGDGVVLIEWAELICDIIPENAIWISIEKDLEKGFDYRLIKVGK
ncbi:MAG: tRNA (adenosine(37)-N6)-threonylcarbamoyltransferase complex ATPase subunit type 1 TsaE [Eubacterium sp.]|nr:tRNA (adenosine(37)-N6)-threonylcarbamoyltransferase complex ATPase subunit type 1 TsaE [Eubacterium sp.]